MCISVFSFSGACVVLEKATYKQKLLGKNRNLTHSQNIFFDPVAPPRVDQCHLIFPVSRWWCLNKDAEHQIGQAQSKALMNAKFLQVSYPVIGFFVTYDGKIHRLILMFFWCWAGTLNDAARMWPPTTPKRERRRCTIFLLFRCTMMGKGTSLSTTYPLEIQQS